MTAITMRFTGWQEDVINTMIKAGMVETKAEALRLALFKVAVDYNLVSPKTLLHVLQEERAKRHLSIEEIMEGVERAKEATIRRQFGSYSGHRQ